MFRPQTERGLKWELLNSWWVLLSLGSFGIFSFISFLYIGFRTKNNLWKVYGLIYFVVFYALGMVTNQLITNILVIIILASIVHAFMVRSKFLITLDDLKRTDCYSEMRQQAINKFDVNRKESKVTPPRSREVKTKAIATSVIKENQLPGMIDINQASEIEIATIPKMGTILARKVIEKREELGGFTSFEEFVREVNLNENVARSVKNRLVFTEDKGENQSSTS